MTDNNLVTLAGEQVSAALPVPPTRLPLTSMTHLRFHHGRSARSFDRLPAEPLLSIAGFSLVTAELPKPSRTVRPRSRVELPLASVPVPSPSILITPLLRLLLTVLLPRWVSSPSTSREEPPLLRLLESLNPRCQPHCYRQRFRSQRPSHLHAFDAAPALANTCHGGQLHPRPAYRGRGR